MSEIVLDASALIAMLKGEKGADKVAAAIADARICKIFLTLHGNPAVPVPG